MGGSRKELGGGGSSSSSGIRAGGASSAASGTAAPAAGGGSSATGGVVLTYSTGSPYFGKIAFRGLLGLLSYLSFTDTIMGRLNVEGGGVKAVGVIQWFRQLGVLDWRDATCTSRKLYS